MGNGRRYINKKGVRKYHLLEGGDESRGECRVVTVKPLKKKERGIEGRGREIR